MQKTPESEIQFIKGVGPKRARLLETELGVTSIDKLLHLYPYKYIDRNSIRAIAEIQPGNAYVQIMAQVISATVLDKAGKEVDMDSGKPGAISRLSVIVSDGSASMELVFFKGIKYMLGRLVPGKTFIFFGKPSLFNGRFNMVHPEIDDPNGQDPTPSGVMTGVYPSTEKLKNAGITGRVMNKIMATALNMSVNTIRETLPDYILKEKGLVPLPYALQNIHFPKDENALKKAEYRLKFEELFLLQLSLLKQKYIRSRNEHGIQMMKVGQAFNDCYNALPYSLTGAQKRVIKEIRTDLMSGKQMNRLVQGDVGSGKTIVAFLAMLETALSGYQAALMAPTEILAEQHFAKMKAMIEEHALALRPVLVTGSMTAKERKTLYTRIATHDADLIIGTHALFQEKVVYDQLALVITDEQHRFGVNQREALLQKGHFPHVLVMSATPIPRTLGLLMYGDLDISILDELPPGRKPIKTWFITGKKRRDMYGFLEKQIAAGHQVYIVCPAIEENEMDSGMKAVKQYYEQVACPLLPGRRIGLLHGKMKPKDKDEVMQQFKAGELDVLVSTTVIEVGVDVPNATVMVIENAERFGLSALHQLRGRVG
ncbi:MAG TPA: ATP-dependent DNA helicase RecG, partial [Rikenellaceae bacterium]|nr:ATP-dependent DNA helicase RecG [Rikenellaceae bacterium]